MGSKQVQLSHNNDEVGGFPAMTEIPPQRFTVEETVYVVCVPQLPMSVNLFLTRSGLLSLIAIGPRRVRRTGCRCCGQRDRCRDRIAIYCLRRYRNPIRQTPTDADLKRSDGKNEKGYSVKERWTQQKSKSFSAVDNSLNGIFG